MRTLLQAMFIFTLVVGFAVAEEKAGESTATTEIKKKLLKPVSLKFKGTPFTKAIKSFSKKSKISIVIDYKTMDKIRNEDTNKDLYNVTLSVTKMQAEIALKMLLTMGTSKKFAYKIKNDAIVIYLPQKK